MSIYQSIYDLFNTYIYGGLIQSGSYEELVCILISTIACLFAFSLPFMVCGLVLYFIVKTLIKIL